MFGDRVPASRAVRRWLPVLEVERASRAALARARHQTFPSHTLCRSALHKAGLRFRLHRRDLSGKPDLVFPRLRTALFVHGCFWHRHPDCKYATSPSIGGRQNC
ncbi:MAG: hypothetical protein V4550_10605 [Gemmatimonadota bacterium]